MTEIVLYSKANCMGCLASELDMTSKNVSYRVIKMDEDPEALSFVKELGYMQAPVIAVYNDGVVVRSWSGFHPDKIEELINL